MIENNIISVYDKIAPEISKVYDQQTHIKSVKSFIGKLPEKAKILDLGCGPGKDVGIFRQYGFQAIGIDGSKGMVDEAKKRYPDEKFIIADVRNLKFPDDHFDAVWSWSVLSHLETKDKITALTEVTRVLKKNGVFTQTLWRGRGRFTNKHIYPRVHFLLSTTSWRKLYMDVGFINFQVQYIKGIGRDSVRFTVQKP